MIKKILYDTHTHTHTHTHTQWNTAQLEKNEIVPLIGEHYAK